MLSSEHRSTRIGFTTSSSHQLDSKAVLQYRVCRKSHRFSVLGLENSVHALAEDFLNSIGESNQEFFRSRFRDLVSCVSPAIFDVGIVSRYPLLKF